MTMEDKKLQSAIDKLAANSTRWLQIKAILVEDIRANQELITLIDEKIKDNEHKIFHLN